MAELQTLARPYAEATFSLARETGTVAQWAEQLSALVAITNESQVAELINNPSTPTNVVIDVISAIAGSALTDDAKRLVTAMAENHRLATLSEVVTQFAQLQAEDEGRVQASVTSAVPLTKAQQASIKSALDAKWSADVDVTYAVDASLVGGAVIKAQDWVIDGSIATQLNKLAAVIAQ